MAKKIQTLQEKQVYTTQYLTMFDGGVQVLLRANVKARIPFKNQPAAIQALVDNAKKEGREYYAHHMVCKVCGQTEGSLLSRQEKLPFEPSFTCQSCYRAAQVSAEADMLEGFSK